MKYSSHVFPPVLESVESFPFMEFTEEVTH